MMPTLQAPAGAPRQTNPVTVWVPVTLARFKQAIAPHRGILGQPILRQGHPIPPPAALSALLLPLRSLLSTFEAAGVGMGASHSQTPALDHLLAKAGAAALGLSLMGPPRSHMKASQQRKIWNAADTFRRALRAAQREIIEELSDVERTLSKLDNRATCGPDIHLASASPTELGHALMAVAGAMSAALATAALAEGLAHDPDLPSEEMLDVECTRQAALKQAPELAYPILVLAQAALRAGLDWRNLIREGAEWGMQPAASILLPDAGNKMADFSSKLMDDLIQSEARIGR